MFLSTLLNKQLDGTEKLFFPVGKKLVNLYFQKKKLKLKLNVNSPIRSFLNLKIIDDFCEDTLLIKNDFKIFIYLFALICNSVKND